MAAGAIEQAEKEGHQQRCNPNDNFTAIIGGIRSCDRFGSTTAKDLNCWDRRSSIDFTRAVRDTDQLEEISAGFFFQELAKNSQAQAECRSDFIGAYQGSPATRQKLNQKAASRFAEMRQELKLLLSYKKQLEDEYKQNLMQALAARNSLMFGEAERADYIQKIDDVKQTVARMIMSLPMGYDPDVAKGVLKMGETGTWDSNIFQQSIIAARKKYSESANYFKARSELNSQGGRHYCIDSDFRKAAQKSGQTDMWIDSMPNSNRGEQLLRERLRCRLNATYGRGPARINTALTVAGIATTIFPLTSIPSMAVRGVKAAQMASTIVRGVNAVSLVMQLENFKRACFGSTFMVSAEKKQCDIVGEFKHMLNETSVSKCAISTAIVGSYIPMQVPAHILRYLRRGVQLVNSATNRK